MTAGKSLTPREKIELDAYCKDVSDNLHVICLVQGVLEDDSAHHAYVMIPKDKYVAFKLAEMRGNYDLAEYGTILAHGDGLFPPEALQLRMKEEYATEADFEELLLPGLVMFAEAMGIDVDAFLADDAKHH